MNDKFSRYLSALQVGDPIRERIEEVLRFSQHICPEDLQNIFVSDQISESGERLFTSMWMFSENFVLEAPRALHEDKFDIVRFTNSVARVDISKNNYHFGGSPTRDSRLSVDITFSPGTELTGNLTATFSNCGYLERIITQRIVPQFRGVGDAEPPSLR